MGKNAIQFDHHGGHHRHTAAMGPHSRQQSIQQSTNMICNRSTSLKLEKNFVTSNMTIIARRVDNDNAMTIASLALLPPLHRCLPHNAASLASLALSCPLQLFLAPVPRVSRNVSSLASPASLGPSHHHLASLALLRVGDDDDPGHEYQQ